MAESNPPRGPNAKAMERQIVSVIASGESHPSMLIMGSSASATMWILVRFYLVKDLPEVREFIYYKTHISLSSYSSRF